MLIHKDNGIIIGVIPNINGSQYYLPGGGVDPGESVIQCAVRETLEEMGIKVANARPTGIASTIDFSDENRFNYGKDKYRGAKTFLIEADFSCFDSTVLNIENDAMEFKHVGYQQAYELLEQHIDNFGGATGIHALIALKKYL